MQSRWPRCPALDRSVGAPYPAEPSGRRIIFMKAATALALTFTVALLAGQFSCTADAGKAEGAKSDTGKSDGTKVATVGDRTITRAELEEHVRPKLIEIDNQRYEALREGL